MPTASAFETRGPSRMTLELPPEGAIRLDELRRQTGAASDAEVVRHALYVYEWYAGQLALGHRLALVKDGTVVKEVVLML